jgi:Zn-dependent peptidase ImmA (M78 family)
MKNPRPKSPAAVRRTVTGLLEQLKIVEPPVPVDLVARHLGAHVKFSPFEGELAGMLVRSAAQIVIGVNSLHHPNRQRFTIAHECGHLVFHKGEFHIDKNFRVNRRDERSRLAVDPEEIDANRFAAELLMPYSMMQADLAEHAIDPEDEAEVQRLAKRYRVSVQAMTHRIAYLFPVS